MRWMSLGLLVLVAGCGGADETLPSAAPPVWTEATCPRSLAEWSKTGGIPDGFTTAWVLRCGVDYQPTVSRGGWGVGPAERADTPAPELLAQLRRPSEPRDKEVACTADMRVPVYFALVDANGKALLPTQPTDVCGRPRIEISKALEELDFKPF